MLRVAERIAQQHHVSPATVKRAEKFVEAVNKLPEEVILKAYQNKFKSFHFFLDKGFLMIYDRK